MNQPAKRGILGRRGLLRRWLEYSSRDVWQVELGGVPTFRRIWTKSFRVFLLALRGFRQDRCVQKAQALTYITIFSFPPLLAFTFAVTKGFGLYTKIKEDVIDPFLDTTFGERVTSAVQPTADGSVQVRDAIDQVFVYVEETDLKALGLAGLAFLLWSVVKMLGSVEHTLNEVWAVKRARKLVRRFTDYLAILVIVPLLLFAGTALNTAILRGRVEIPWTDIGFSLSPLVVILPIAVSGLGVTFLLLALPNTRVRFPSALLGGIVSGLFFQLLQILHVEAQVGLAKASPIYSSFAAVPILMAWVFLSWTILLVGAELAHAHQSEPMQASLRRQGEIDQRVREELAPRLVGRITRAFLAGEGAPGTDQLASELGVHPRAVSEVLDCLVENEILARTGENGEEGFLLARDPDTIHVLDLLQALRRRPGVASAPVLTLMDERVDRILASFRETLGATGENHTLLELARTPEEASLADHQVDGVAEFQASSPLNDALGGDKKSDQ